MEGPSNKITYFCKGCSFLMTKDWVFYGENDDIDRGCDATCLKLNKNICTYYYETQSAPDWCPYLIQE